MFCITKLVSRDSNSLLAWLAHGFIRNENYMVTNIVCVIHFFANRVEESK